MTGRERHAGANEVFGWDIGGAHVKVCRLSVDGGDTHVREVVQWPCPLWQGLEHLQRVLDDAHRRWPALNEARHAATMTGEMVDLFSDREDGVRRIAQALCDGLGAPAAGLRFHAGAQGWCAPDAVAAHWPAIASANWLATAMHVASRLPEGVLVDIGSTTTDLIAFRGRRVLGRSGSDADRLASGELVYHGVVRTPLCAIAPRIALRGTRYNVMNEWFATSADVYRLTGELDPAHDQHPSADNGPKDLPGTRRRLARMVGMDARDAADADWLAFAHAWRAAQLDTIGGQLERVCSAHGIGPEAPLVSAGCGDFLAAALASRTDRHCIRYASLVMAAGPEAAAAADSGSGGAADLARWTQVCAPSVAVASLFAAAEAPACG